MNSESDTDKEAAVAAGQPMTPDMAVAHICRTNPLFETGNVDIRGTRFTAFRNIPPTIPALLKASRDAQDGGAAEYLVYGAERWTYDAFCNDIDKLTAVLQKQFGIAKGDRVALAMRNYPEMLVAMLAISAAGGVVTFLNAWWTTEELDYALGDSGAKLVLADAARLERLTPLIAPRHLVVIGVRDAEPATQHRYSTLMKTSLTPSNPVNIDTDDDFAIMYSSGSTGHPKGVIQTHRGALNAVFSWLLQAVIAPLVTPPAADAPPAPRPVGLVVTPLFHVTATHPVFLLSLPAGAKLILMHKWDPKRAVELVKEHQVTRFLGVPTQSAELMQAARALGETLPSLDYIGAGGAKRPPAQVADLAKTFPNAGVATGWGMTETNALGIGLIGDDYVSKPGVAGKLHPPVQELRILDDNGQPVPNGTLGEITVKSPANMRGYLNKPEATDAALKDGWLSTGDLGVLDDDGYVTILDRKKNIIIRGGENIACLDVEGAVHQHPDVIEACAFSVPDARLGEVVGVAVQLHPDSKLAHENLTEFLTGHLAPFKIPQHLWCQTEPLLRGATDKTDRRAQRAACLAASGLTETDAKDA